MEATTKTVSASNLPWLKFENKKYRFENGWRFELGLDTAKQGSGIFTVSNLNPNPRVLIRNFIRDRLENQEGYKWSDRTPP